MTLATFSGQRKIMISSQSILLFPIFMLLMKINQVNSFQSKSSIKNWVTKRSSVRQSHHAFRTHYQMEALKMNFFSDIGDALTGGKLATNVAIPYDPPFCPTHSTKEEPAKFAIRERALSFTGEDFDIYCPERNSPIVRVRGAMLHLPGKDKMRITSDGDEVVVLDRVLMAVSPTYDIYRGGMNAEKVGWVEKKIVALEETFDVYMEGKGGFGPFKPPPAFEISGDFLERNFVMKNDKNEVVAKFSKVCQSM